MWGRRSGHTNRSGFYLLDKSTRRRHAGKLAYSVICLAQCGVGGGGIRAGGETGLLRFSRTMSRSITWPIRIAPPGRAAATPSVITSWSPWSLPSTTLWSSSSFYPLRNQVREASSRVRLFEEIAPRDVGWLGPRLAHVGRPSIASLLQNHFKRSRWCLNLGYYQAGQRSINTSL